MVIVVLTAPVVLWRCKAEKARNDKRSDGGERGGGGSGGSPFSVSYGRLALLLLVGFFMSTGDCLGFYAVRNMPLGDYRMIAASLPVFVGVFGKLFLREACGIFQSVTMSLTLVGVFIVMKPPFVLDLLGLSELQVAFFFFGWWWEGWHSLANFLTRPNQGGTGRRPRDPLWSGHAGLGRDRLAFLRGRHHQSTEGDGTRITTYCTAQYVGTAHAVLTLFMLTILFLLIKGMDAIVITMSCSCVGVWIGLSASGLFGTLEAPSASDAGIMTLAGLASALGILFLVMALKADDATAMSLARKSEDILVSMLVQVLYFGEIPTALTLFGAALILACILLLGCRKVAESRKDSGRCVRGFFCLPEPVREAEF